MMSADTVLMHERVLVERARSGNRLAFEEIYRQTSPAAWRFALAVARDEVAAAGAVAAGYAKALNQPAATAPQLTPIATQVLRATRDAALDAAPAAPPSGGPLALRAFRELPERWRAALWLLDVEARDERAASVVLSLAPQAAEDLAARARAGLRERAAALQLEDVTDPACARATERLDAYATDALPTREAGRLRRHLDSCDECRDRLVELDDLLPRLRRAVPPAPAGLVDDSERAWRAAAVAASGPLHLRMPGGAQLPAWAERALAGAAAAVVTLGIAGALIASRGGGRVGDHLARETATSETPLGTADGESALGDIGDLPLSLPDGAALPVVRSGDGGGTTDGGAEQALPREGARGAVSSPAAQEGTSTTAPSQPPAPAPTSPTTPTVPKAPSTPQAPTSPSSPTAPVGPTTVTDAVETVVGTVEDTVDEACGALGVSCGDVLEPVTSPLGGLGL